MDTCCRVSDSKVQHHSMDESSSMDFGQVFVQYSMIVHVLQKPSIGAFCNTFLLHLAATCLYLYM